MNRKKSLRCLWIAGLLLGLCGQSNADTHVQQDLYLDAMRSITEGRQDDASEALTRMIEQEPQHAGAWLDLAIIQCELGHAAEAERLFQTIEARFAPPPAILEVISHMRAHGCTGWQPRSSLSLMVGRGMDSNVNQGASNPNFSIGTGGSRIELQLLPEYMPRSDHYTVVSAEYLRDLTTNGSIGFVQARVQQNDTLSSFNTSSLALGLEHPWRFGNWGVRGTGMAALFGLGGQLYQRQAQIQARITPPLPLPNHLQFNMLAGLSHLEYATLQNFDSNTWELRGLLSYRTERGLVEASVGHLTDRALSARPGGDRDGWFASLYGRTRLGGDVIGELGWTRQTWVSQSAYSPGLISQIRNQDTQVLRGALIIPIRPHHSINVELRQVHNNENISIFQYNSRQLQVSWQWQGF
ncbi:MAG TPA: tetratricopeptide repeat protein [Noviherbaspirillum sp.]